MEKNELISYAMDFVSYLVLNINEIKRVILYGSVPREDFDKESDIDLFVDAGNDVSKKVQKTLKDYYYTIKFKEWELKGIKKEFHIISGNLDSSDWKDLKRSMLNNSIILYGNYKADIEKINHYILFSFENIKPDKKRIVVFRKLFGFKTSKKNYGGLINKTNSLKIGKGIILVPVESHNEIKKYLKEKKVSFKIFDFWSDNKLT